MLLVVVDYGQALGLDAELRRSAEGVPGQLELNFRATVQMRTADNITTYRQVCAAVALRHDLRARKMPKPFTGVSANGHHHHFTLIDEAEQRLPRPRWTGAALWRTSAALPWRHV